MRLTGLLLLLYLLSIANQCGAQKHINESGFQLGAGYQFMNIRNNPRYLPTKTFPPLHAFGVHAGYRLDRHLETNLNISYGRHQSNFSYFGKVTRITNYWQVNADIGLKFLYIRESTNCFVSMITGTSKASYKLSSFNNRILGSNSTSPSESAWQFAFGTGMNIHIYRYHFVKIQTALTPSDFYIKKNQEKNTPPFNAYIHYAYLF